MLNLYNSYTKSLEEVELSQDVIKIYLCGPTVQSSPHIGHGRSSVVFDLLIRYLKYLNHKVLFVRNITDIDDKIISKSSEQGIEFQELANKVMTEFVDVYSSLNCLTPDKEPKATEYIDEIKDYITQILKKDMAYISESGVYFETSNFTDYLKLSGRKLDEVISGTRVELQDDKNAPEDFALWKFAKEGEPYWDSEWGKGRPGWHIECSAMINALLGEEIDFHCGGNDLIFPHHENELAQSKAAKPSKNFVKYWLHNGMINLSGKKMSKSEGNVKILKDYIDEYSGDVMRFYFLRAQYRSPQEFTEDLLIESRTTFKKISEFVEESKPDPIDKNLLNIFEVCMEDDLNTPKLIGEIFIKINQSLTLEEEELQNLRSTVRFIFDILGFTFIKVENEKLPKDKLIKFFEEYKIIFETIEQAMSEFINIREEYRIEREYKVADEMRNKLLEIGIKIEDGKKDGWSWNNN
ncbi:cysteine--tRNA ligase [Acidimicrobiia bacterium]|nr:cysteine--tRNA ligase [Acidimicrobiia bacterium]MDC3404417.1 cysteine--tRNA ligase [Acidimicrobiia bacterium]